jgi:FAD/FMN-containing dehydrogenase
MVATRESSDPNRDLWWAHTLYYKDNYPRLQRIKTCWDPRNVFHHALSIRA